MGVKVWCVVAALCWPAVVWAQDGPDRRQPSEAGNRAANIMVAASMVTSGIDYGVTMYGLGRGLEEAHPLWRRLQDRPVVFGAVKLGSSAATSYGLIKIPKHQWKKKLIIASVITAVNVWAIQHNAHVIRRQR